MVAKQVVIVGGKKKEKSYFIRKATVENFMFPLGQKNASVFS